MPCLAQLISELSQSIERPKKESFLLFSGDTKEGKPERQVAARHQYFIFQEKKTEQSFISRTRQLLKVRFCCFLVLGENSLNCSQDRNQGKEDCVPVGNLLDLETSFLYLFSELFPRVSVFNMNCFIMLTLQKIVSGQIQDHKAAFIKDSIKLLQSLLIIWAFEIAQDIERDDDIKGVVEKRNITN